MFSLAHRGFALAHPERHIGRLLRAHGYETAHCGTEHLVPTGLERDTFVFAFTDHGLQWPLHIGKAVFLAARGPAHFAAGRTFDAMVSLLDLVPTVCALTGLRPPSWL